MNVNLRESYPSVNAPQALLPPASDFSALPAVAPKLAMVPFGPGVGPMVIPFYSHAKLSIKSQDDFSARLLKMLLGLTSCSGGQAERELDAAFRQTCHVIEIDRAAFWCQLGTDTTSLTLTHQCVCRENCENDSGVTNDTSSLQPISNSKRFSHKIRRAQLPWISAQVQANQTVVFSSQADLPPEANRDMQTLRELGMSAGVAIPFRSDGLVTAVLIALSRKERSWPAATMERLQLATQILSYFITRRSREEKLAAALAKANDFKTALDAHTIVAMSNAQGNFSYVNDKFCELSKYSREELLGNDHQLVNSDHHSKEFFGEIWNTISRGQMWQGEIKHRAKDGSYYWAATKIIPFLNELGELREYMSILFDITERKLAEEALTKSNLEIKRLKDQLQAETDYLRTEIRLNEPHKEIIGRSKAMKRVLQQVEQVAPVDCSVLISGETGTGKELIARAIHRLSARRDHAMVVVNCGALPAPLVESELFGRERGAFTGALTSEVGRFEIANGSTIFLDEIGELSLDIQVKLLRVLQDGEFQRLGNPKTRKVDLRVIAATNKNLAREVREGRFREDLYYRLGVFPIEVPPLRQRMEDLPLLVSAFVDECSSRMNKQINRIPSKALEALERHQWPGNIRELRNIIERAVILSSGETLTLPNLGDLPKVTIQPTSLAEVERDHILKTLEDADWRIKGPYGAAKRLCLKPSTLYSRMAKLGVRRHGMKLAAPADLT